MATGDLPCGYLLESKSPSRGIPSTSCGGLAREVLSCDVLRIIGCRLDGNDWDLVSLLFNSLHDRTEYRPFRVEVIDSPQQAIALQQRFPYLGAQSLLEIDGIGPQMVAEVLGGEPRGADQLTASEQRRLRDGDFEGKNWFGLWLEKKAGALFLDLGSIETDLGAFARMLEGEP